MDPQAPTAIAVVWSGLPAYAARLIAASEYRFPVIATRPRVPILGMDEILPGRIHWIDNEFCGGFSDLGLTVPRLMIVPSWNSRYAKRLEVEVRNSGGRVIVAFDNVWKGSWRQILGALAFRIVWRDRFCAAWVVGAGGRRLARIFGFKKCDIFDHLYGTDPSIFSAATPTPLKDRPKRIIFTGRLIPEKGLLDLLKAWQLFQPMHPEWSLHIYGTGPMEAAVQEAQVVFHGFKQPADLALALSEARFLVLPSHDEHWGLVVCEAAQAGCGLLLSLQVGSVPDLLGPYNGESFPPKAPEKLAAALTRAARLSTEELSKMEAESRSLGLSFTPAHWSERLDQIVARYL